MLCALFVGLAERAAKKFCLRLSTIFGHCPWGKLSIQQLGLCKAADNWEDHGLVFPNLRGGYLHPGHMGESFRKLLKEAGLPHIHFHDLRHSAASILLCMGVNVKVIQELLGHSDISITLRTYSHLLPSLQQEVVKTWNEVFGEDEKGNEKQG